MLLGRQVRAVVFDEKDGALLIEDPGKLVLQLDAGFQFRVFEREELRQSFSSVEGYPVRGKRTQSSVPRRKRGRPLIVNPLPETRKSRNPEITRRSSRSAGSSPFHPTEISYRFG